MNNKLTPETLKLCMDMRILANTMDQRANTLRLVRPGDASDYPRRWQDVARELRILANGVQTQTIGIPSGPLPCEVTSQCTIYAPCADATCEQCQYG
jgi:hypothetical protein